MFVVHMKKRHTENLALFETEQEVQDFVHRIQQDEGHDDDHNFAFRLVELNPNEVVYDIASPSNMHKTFYDFFNDRVVVND